MKERKKKTYPWGKVKSSASQSRGSSSMEGRRDSEEKRLSGGDFCEDRREGVEACFAFLGGSIVVNGSCSEQSVCEIQWKCRVQKEFEVVQDLILHELDLARRAPMFRQF